MRGDMVKIRNKKIKKYEQKWQNKKDDILFYI